MWRRLLQTLNPNPQTLNAKLLLPQCSPSVPPSVRAGTTTRCVLMRTRTMTPSCGSSGGRRPPPLPQRQRQERRRRRRSPSNSYGASPPIAGSVAHQQRRRSQELTELLGGVNTVDEAIEAVRYLLQQSNSAEESASLAAAQSVRLLAPSRPTVRIH